MKLTQEFVLRNVAGDNILIPVTGIGNNFDGLITLNETGVLIWKGLEKGLSREQIVDSILEEYEVTREKALQDVENILDQLRTLGILA